MARDKQAYVAFGFSSTHDAMNAEAALKDQGIPARTIPRPVFMGGAECGIALRVAPADAQRASGAFSAAGIEPAAQEEFTDV